MTQISKYHVLSVVMMAGLCAVSTVQGSGGEGVHWGYSGKAGPEHWGKLSPQYSVCDTGRNQSPINLTSFIEAELESLTLQYSTEAKDILNNGHAVQINFAPGSTLNVEGRTYELKQIHFHSPSENTIDMQSYPMEGHLVHADSSGQLAVIGVMYAEGKENPAMAAAWKEMPGAAGDTKALSGVGTAVGFLPASLEYYRFNGSLTTPPCSEGVTWIVLKETVEVSAAQIGKFKEVMGQPNNRPVQPINARVVLE